MKVNILLNFVLFFRSGLLFLSLRLRERGAVFAWLIVGAGVILSSCSDGGNPWRDHVMRLSRDICQKRVLCHQNEIQKTKDFFSDKIKEQTEVALPDHYLRQGSCEKYFRKRFRVQKVPKGWDEEMIEQKTSSCRNDYRKQKCRDIVMSKTIPRSCRLLTEIKDRDH